MEEPPRALKVVQAMVTEAPKAPVEVLTLVEEAPGALSVVRVPTLTSVAAVDGVLVPPEALEEGASNGEGNTKGTEGSAGTDARSTRSTHTHIDRRHSNRHSRREG